ncbi:WD repeat-containing protein 11 [Triticum urartu]|uniref:WD repeat-containing protein 11 n=1 Tax=Triticum urartu TaxID=4572 RepID=M7ZWC5_TRIUA|nr:WD repeat-containing protein 11 [Triticum urartu]
MFDASPEYLSCLRRDPFDDRHLCALGLKGFLLSAVPRHDSDISLKEHRIVCGAGDVAELQRLEKDISAPAPAPALAAFPLFAARLCFSPLWRHILYAVYPRELVVFELNYSTVLSVATLPRGFGKFTDVMADTDLDLLYCTHADGKLSIWKRKEGEQVHLLHAVEELMPSIGTVVPPPAVLATTIWQSESIFRNIDKQSQDLAHMQSSQSMIFDTKSNQNMYQGTMTYLTSISEDGKIWSWHLTFDNPAIKSTDDSISVTNVGKEPGGGNNPAPAVPLVALGTQNGTIEVVDVLANAVSVSFAVHSSTVRGLRWLGNSRLASFSYNQVSDKSGGYNNKLVITCLRSGLNRPFRVLQKPERAAIRALRASSSGRYLLIMFRDAPVEVWAMTKNPIMLRSLALPFTVLEWTLPAAPRPSQNASKQSSTSKEGTAAESSDESSESFAFALVNGALGVFEVHGRRIRDFRPKWPSSSFASSDGLVTAMAYRLPHVVMGDRSGNIRWWDVITGLSSSFSTHREGIRRIKFSPVVHGDRSRGRIAVLFYDNTFSIFDLDSADPLANALLHPQSPGTLVLELDWLSTRTRKDEPLVLCIAGADSSFRLVEVNTDTKINSASRLLTTKERFRPMPLCLPILFPTAHALLGVKPSWFECNNSDTLGSNSFKEGPATFGDLRSYMIETTLPPIGDSVVAELLLKVLEPYRKDGCILDDGRATLYSAIVNKGTCARFAFAAAIFGDFQEALFWLQLPQALQHSLDKSTSRSSEKGFESSVRADSEQTSTLNRIASSERSAARNVANDTASCGQLSTMAFKQEQLWFNANERIPWHDKLDSEDALQKRIHELVSLGNLEAAVSLLLSTPPEGTNFYPNALRAVVLSSAVSRSLHELAVKVVAANMVRTDKSLSGTHLLCAVGKYQEACSQLQDAGCWIDAATLAATHLRGSDYARVLQRWAGFVLRGEQNMWRALILYVAAGALPEALETLRSNQRPDTAALFLLACHEIYSQITTESKPDDEVPESATERSQKLLFPSKNGTSFCYGKPVDSWDGEFQNNQLGTTADDVGEMVRIGGSTCLEVTVKFARAVVKVFGADYSREPIVEDTERLMAIGASRGVPMVQLIARTGNGRTAPKHLRGMHQGHAKEATIIFEEVTSKDL